MKDLKHAPEGSPIRINDLLDKFGLGDAFDELLFQQGKALGFKPGSKAEAYIFGYWTRSKPTLQTIRQTPRPMRN